MVRSMISGLLTLVTLAVSVPALAQDADSPPAKSKNRTLRYADDDKKPAVGVEVVEPSRSSVLKQWEVNQNGQPAMTHIIPSVVGITLLANGRDDGARARWTFALTNTGDRATYFILNVAECYIVDEQGESYRPTAYQYAPDRGGYWQADLRPDAKTKFTMDFDVPKAPSKSWKIGMVLKAQRGLHATDAIKLFTVKLKKPLFYDDGIFETDEDEKGAKGKGVNGGKPAPGPDGPGPDGGPTIPFPPKSSPREVEEIQEKFRGLSEDGRWIEGNLSIGGRANVRVRLVFKKRARSEFVEATLHWLDGTPRSVELHGAYFENSRFASGLALVLRDRSDPKAEYTLHLEGNNLSGNDGLGNTLSFIIPARK